jgi:hypothetical protein
MTPARTLGRPPGRGGPDSGRYRRLALHDERGDDDYRRSHNEQVEEDGEDRIDHNASTSVLKCP